MEYGVGDAAAGDGTTTPAGMLPAVPVPTHSPGRPRGAPGEDHEPGNGQRRRRRHHHHHHHHHHRHHRSQSAPLAPQPAPLDDIEDMVPLDEWGQSMLEGGRLGNNGAAATVLGFGPPAPSNRPVGVVIPRFIGRKRPRGGASTTTTTTTTTTGASADARARARSASGSGSGAEEAAAATATGGEEQQQHLRNVSTTVLCSNSSSVDSLPALAQQHHHHAHAQEDGGLAALPLPGAQRIWVRTCGCSHNVSDSEYMEGMLADYGYELVPEAERETAELWLLNSCTVKNPSEAGVVNLVQKAKDLGKKVVVAGCVPQGDRHMAALQDGVSVLGVAQIPRVVEVVEQTLAGHTVRLLAKAPLPSLDLPKIRRNPLVEILPLSTGCLGACTYCKTRHARGRLGSYAVEAIVARAKAVFEEGVVTELWLSSEDTGAYGRDLAFPPDDDNDNSPRPRPGLTRLLDALLPALPPRAMLRLGMTNPPFILDQLEAVAAALRHPNVYSFLHIPVQAGSDAVLTEMNREYTVAEFKRVVDYLREHVPGVTIATDIICGFPGETEADFDATLALVEAYAFPVVNISQFYARPGTPAAKMPRVPTRVVKDRSRRLTRLFEGFRPYEGMEGRELDVWINAEVSGDGRHSVGHTKAYAKVLVPRDEALRGTQARVRVVSTARFHVVGEVLSFQPVHPRTATAAAAGAGAGAEAGAGGSGDGGGVLLHGDGDKPARALKEKAMARARARKFRPAAAVAVAAAAVAAVEAEEEGEEAAQRPPSAEAEAEAEADGTAPVVGSVARFRPSLSSDALLLFNQQQQRERQQQQQQQQQRRQHELAQAGAGGGRAPSPAVSAGAEAAAAGLRRSLSSSALLQLQPQSQSQQQHPSTTTTTAATTAAPLACTVQGPDGKLLHCSLAGRAGGCFCPYSGAGGGGGGGQQPQPQPVDGDDAGGCEGEDGDCSCTSTTCSRCGASSSAASTATSFLPTGEGPQALLGGGSGSVSGLSPPLASRTLPGPATVVPARAPAANTQEAGGFSGGGRGGRSTWQSSLLARARRRVGWAVLGEGTRQPAGGSTALATTTTATVGGGRRGSARGVGSGAVRQQHHHRRPPPPPPQSLLGWARSELTSPSFWALAALLLLIAAWLAACAGLL